jgi:hypothetical protein
MKPTLVVSLLTALLLTASSARADSPAPSLPQPLPMLAHVEIGGAEHAVFISPDGDGGALEVDVPGQTTTRVKVRLTRRGPATLPGVAFEVMHVGTDKASFTARGEIALPTPGKPVLVARVPQKGKSLDILLSLTPAR